MGIQRSGYIRPGTFLLIFLAAACSDDSTGYWQASAAEQARELDLLHGVTVIEMSREEFAQRAEDRAQAIDEQQLVLLAETLGRLGYFDMDLDLRPIMAGASSDWVGATYSPSSKLITLVGEARDDTVVHEFVHALQDQHFNLVAYDSYETSDSFLARRAVVEGDATLAQYRFMANEEGRELDSVDWESLLGSWRDYSQELLVNSGYPMVFLDYVSFVYPYGLAYGAANLLAISHDQPNAPQPAPHDWSLQDELFLTRPAATTEQILALDVNGSGQQSDPVVEFGLRDVPASLRDELTSVDWDRLGVWYIYLLLLPLELDGVIEDARALALAWDGDTVLFARQSASDEVISLWATAWDTEQAAADVAAAMRALYGADEPEEGFAATAADGERVWIEQRGDRLVVSKNAPDAMAEALAEAAFGPATLAAPRLRPSLAAQVERLRRPMEHHCHHAALVIPAMHVP